MRKPRRSAAKVVTILALGLAGFALAGIGAGVGLATDTTGTTGTTGTTDTTTTGTTTTPPPPPPEEGCTLTPGYWKTHADPTRKQFDETWNLILPSGPDTIFFQSGQTYLQVLEQDKSDGNAYYILAFQWIAAQLNQLAGASITGAAAAAFDDAEALLTTADPDVIGSLSGDDPLRQEFISLAATLDDYNNGVIGPGHCDD